MQGKKNAMFYQQLSRGNPLAEEIKEKQKVKKLKVLVQTGGSGRDGIKRAFSVGCNNTSHWRRQLLYINLVKSTLMGGSETWAVGRRRKLPRES